MPETIQLADRLPRGRAAVWAEKVKRLVAAGDVRSPRAILEGLGMDDPHHLAQALRCYGEGE